MYLAVPFCILSFLGTAVSMKYEVDHGRFAVETNEKLTESEKVIELQEINKYEAQLNTQAFFLAFIAIVLFIVATALIVKRNKFLV